jgi:hypothetical protein
MLFASLLERDNKYYFHPQKMKNIFTHWVVMLTSNNTEYLIFLNEQKKYIIQAIHNAI